MMIVYLLTLLFHLEFKDVRMKQMGTFKWVGVVT